MELDTIYKEIGTKIASKDDFGDGPRDKTGNQSRSSLGLGSFSDQKSKTRLTREAKDHVTNMYKTDIHGTKTFHMVHKWYTNH